MRYVVIGFHALSIVFVAHGLMLLGADEITTIERGGILTVRTLGRIMALYGADPAPWVAAMPGLLAAPLALALSWPAWAVLFGIGGIGALLTRERM